MIIDQLPLLGGDVQTTDEFPIERGTTSYKTTQAALVKTATDAAAAAQLAADNAQDTADEANAKGLPPGGTAGQVLTKADSSDYSATWEDPSGGDVTADMIGIVITGARPAVAVTAGQYVIVRNSTITGITDGLYTAVNALSPSTDVTAANLTAVSDGGLNALNSAIKADSFTISKRPTTGDVFAPAGFGIAENTTRCFVMCFLPVQWVNKANMSISVSNVNDWCLFGDSYHAISDIRLSAASTNCIMLEITSSNLAAGACYRMYANNTQSASLTITVS